MLNREMPLSIAWEVDCFRDDTTILTVQYPKPLIFNTIIISYHFCLINKLFR